MWWKCDTIAGNIVVGKKYNIPHIKVKKKKFQLKLGVGW